MLEKIIRFIGEIIPGKKIISSIVLISMLCSFFIGLNIFKQEAKAVSQHDARGGILVTGIEAVKAQANAGS